jgi:beta-lactamase regulating signal transducer with metallopeptidase domain
METIIIILSCWLLTYFLHSTAFYGLAKLLSQMPAFAHTQAREILWKVALCAGVLTTSIQVFTGAGVFTSTTESFVGAQEIASAKESLVKTPIITLPSPASIHATEIETISSDKPAESMEDDIKSAQASSLFAFFEWEKTYLFAFFVWLSISFVLIIRLFTQKYFFFKSILPREKVTDETLLYTLFKLCNSGGIDQKIVLTASPNLCSPLAMHRGEICLPARCFTELSLEQQQSMLAHELAHIVRRDDRWLKWCNFLETVLFFQPLNRLMRVELQEIIEQRCDEWAIRSTGNAKPLADCLIKVAEWITEPTSLRFASGMALHQSSLRQRIMNILKNQYFNQKDVSRMKVVFSLALVFVIAIVLFPGKTWFSVGFAHHSKFAHIFNQQEISFGNQEDDSEQAMSEIEVDDLEIDIPEMPEMPELCEPITLADADILPASLQSGDTLRFGKDFMLITKVNGNFEIYKDNKIVEEEDYEKYKDEFIVKNGNSIEILTKNGVKVNTGRDDNYATAWGWHGQNITIPPMPAFAPMPSWDGLFSRSSGNGISHGFFSDDDNDDYTYSWEEDGEEIEVEFDKEYNVKHLQINDKEIDKADFPKYQKWIDKAKENIKQDREKIAKYKSEIREYEDKMRNYELIMQKITLADEKIMQEREQAIRKIEQDVQRKQEEVMQRHQRQMDEVARKFEKQARQMDAKARMMKGKSQENTDKILDELLSDGLIKSKKGTYEMRLNKRGLFIDDEKQSETLFEKYKKLFETLTGNKIENDNSFVISND